MVTETFGSRLSQLLIHSRTRPRASQYTVFDKKSEQDILTKASSSLVQGQSLSEFLHQARDCVLLSDNLGCRFALLENRELWDKDGTPEGSVVVDIVPTRGSLVVFDSVLFPHHVETIWKGSRVALAGWFHVKAQTDMVL